LEAARSRGDRQGVAAALLQRSDIAVETGAFAEGRIFIEESLEIYKNTQNPLGVALATNSLARLDYRSGRVNDSLAEFEQVRQLAKGLGDIRLYAHAEVHKAKAYLLLGDSDTGERLIRESAVALVKLDDAGMVAHAKIVLAEVGFKQRPKETVCLLKEAISLLEKDPEGCEVHELYLVTARIGLERGLRDESALLLSASRRYFSSRSAQPDPIFNHSSTIEESSAIDPGSPRSAYCHALAVLDALSS
jgi:hypothetical protein